MRKLLFMISLVLASLQSYAQQDVLYTQYLVSALGFNPAYTGSRETFSSIFLYRYQWVNIDGAPRTYTVNLHSPLGGSKFSLGAALNYDKVGEIKRTEFMISGSYKIDFERSKLNFGLSAGARQYSALWSAVNTNSPFNAPDPAFTQDYVKWQPNFGVGIYWWNPTFSLGFSLPMITVSNLSPQDPSKPSETERHYYFSGSYLYDINEDWQFKPSAFVKFAAKAPAQLDVTSSFIYNNKLRLGGTLRNFEALCAIVQYYPSNNWYFGYSYDYYMNTLSNYNAGSHEIFIGIDLRVRNSLVQSPRYF